MDLDALLARFDGMPAEKLNEIESEVLSATSDRRFIPSPGPQTDAWFSKADLLLYGGEAGGGKSGLLCGLALEAHTQSLLMRRRSTDMEGGGGLIEDLLRIHGSRDGYSGKPPPTLKTDTGRIVTFGSAMNIGDEEKFQGRPRDLLGIDEAAQFAKQQILFLMGWVRTIVEGQRTRTVLASNPPISAEGQWMVEMFRPWLDITHHNPANQGELRWYIRTKNDEEVEVDGPDLIERDGETYRPKSRTFIRASLTDNPYIIADDYQKELDALPEPFRSAMRDGNFMAARQDAQNQVIPSEWVMAAQQRWTPERPEHAPMSAMGVDVAQGGKDQTALSPRYDAWFDEVETIPGSQTKTGSDVAGLVIARRRNNAVIVVDLGGGWGGSTSERLDENGIEVRGFDGSKASVRRTQDRKIKFYNMRAEAWWRFREALDPDQDGGSPVALPPDPEVLADLTAPTFEVKARGIILEEKKQIAKRIGRSPDKGDAVVMAWSDGPQLATHGNQWRKAMRQSRPGAKPNVIMGRIKRRK